VCHVFVHEKFQAYPNCFFLFSFQSAIHDAEEKRNFKILMTGHGPGQRGVQLELQVSTTRVSGVTSGPQFASLPAAYATGPRPRKSADDVERTWVLGGGRGAEHKLMCRPGPTAQHK